MFQKGFELKKQSKEKVISNMLNRKAMSVLLIFGLTKTA